MNDIKYVLEKRDSKVIKHFEDSKYEFGLHYLDSVLAIFEDGHSVYTGTYQHGSFVPLIPSFIKFAEALVKANNACKENKLFDNLEKIIKSPVLSCFKNTRDLYIINDVYEVWIEKDNNVVVYDTKQQTNKHCDIPAWVYVLAGILQTSDLYTLKVGTHVHICNMYGEPQYAGKEGMVTRIDKDCYGVTRAHGTWGGCCLYPDKDDYFIIG